MTSVAIWASFLLAPRLRLGAVGGTSFSLPHGPASTGTTEINDVYPLLDQMTALLRLSRQHPEISSALPASSPLGGGPLEPVLFGLVDLGLALERDPDDRARLTILGLGVNLHLAAIAGAQPGHLPSPADILLLAGLQIERLRRHRGPDVWRNKSPKSHLGSAFRQLLILAAHLGVAKSRRPLIDLLGTVADLANYVAFTLDAAGVFDAPAGASREGSACAR